MVVSLFQNPFFLYGSASSPVNRMVIIFKITMIIITTIIALLLWLDLLSVICWRTCSPSLLLVMPIISTISITTPSRVSLRLIKKHVDIYASPQSFFLLARSEN